jgi:hypothetical protein
MANRKSQIFVRIEPVSTLKPGPRDATGHVRNPFPGSSHTPFCTFSLAAEEESHRRPFVLTHAVCKFHAARASS